MKLNELPQVPAGRQEPKRKGQGIGSGNGKTAGRGTKGQHARSGGFHRVGFEGGQMPLQMRLPKRGFKNHFKKVFALISVGQLEAKFAAGSEVTVDTLLAAGMVNKTLDGVKLLADGELTKALNIQVDRASKAAIAKVEAAGGKITLSQVAEDSAA
ncbi:MAG: 50S ribosomal protein L15 [Magnetococcales bacterium]|nr:50S ribosomal protein L15 [Magnetococcales bacterium]NGZ27349.1 50S ribosomal protein L15 [Magnetococcales bacterium]